MFGVTDRSAVGEPGDALLGGVDGVLQGSAGTVERRDRAHGGSHD